MKITFTKMHGLGNDVIVARADGVEPPDAERIRELADRRTGIGFDQFMWLSPPLDPGADIRYRIFNADGSVAEQCGNGARCVARHCAGENARSGTLRLEHPTGIAVARIDGDQVAISMGEPDFTPARIPFVTDSQADEYDLKTPSGDATVGVVSMGNPHAVMLVDDVDRAPVGLLGPELENHAQFPNRANIGFMQIVDRGHVRLRVYERGAGETRACGTGACAAMAVGRRAGLLDEKVSVQLPGGALCVKWSGPGDEAWLAGEAVTVFEGEVDI